MDRSFPAPFNEGAGAGGGPRVANNEGGLLNFADNLS